MPDVQSFCVPRIILCWVEALELDKQRSALRELAETVVMGCRGPRLCGQNPREREQRDQASAKPVKIRRERAQSLGERARSSSEIWAVPEDTLRQRKCQVNSGGAKPDWTTLVACAPMQPLGKTQCSLDGGGAESRRDVHRCP
jgi:hypothetical protein